VTAKVSSCQSASVFDTNTSSVLLLKDDFLLRFVGNRRVVMRNVVGVLIPTNGLCPTSHHIIIVETQLEVVASFAPRSCDACRGGLAVTVTPGGRHEGLKGAPTLMRSGLGPREEVATVFTVAVAAACMVHVVCAI